MTQDTWPTPQGRAAQAASVFSDILTGPGLINLEAAIAAAITLDREAQAARLANALAYCAEADNESMEQARTIRAQAVEIERLAGVIEIHRKATTTWRESCHQAWRDLSAARASIEHLKARIENQADMVASYRDEAQAARDALILHLPTHGPIEPDELADDMINDGIAAIKRRQGQQ